MKRMFSLFANKSVHRLAATVLIFGVMVAQVTAHPLRRIRFKPGATKVSVVGRLRGQNDILHYVLRVRGGQHMHIALESTQLTNPMISVTFPSGEGSDRDMQGSQFDTDATQAGDYHIDVYEGRKGDPSNGKFVLKITVD